MKNTKNLILMGLCFISLFGLGAQSIEEGRRLTRNEKYESAESVFNELIKLNAKKGDPYYWAGINFLERGDTAAAMEIFEKGLVAVPKYTLTNVGKAQIMLRQGKKAEAEALFLLALKTKKKMKPVVNREIGRAYLMIKDRSKAVIVENAKTALTYFAAASSTDFEVKLLQGDAMFITNPTDATEAITRYIESGYLNESDPQPLLREALLYQKVQNYDISMVRVDEALAKDAGFAPAYRQKADLFSDMKQRDSAVKYYKEYLKLNDNFSARRKYISALYYNTEFDEAIKEAKSLLAQKEYANLYGLIAYAIVEKKDTSKALNKEGLEYFEKYEERFLKNAGRGMSVSEKFYKSMLLSKTGQKEVSWVYQKEVLTDTSHASVRWYDMARELAYTSKEYAKSIEILKLKESKTHSMSDLDKYYLAMSYRMNEQYMESNNVFNEIVNKDSTYIKGYYYMALNWHLMDETDSTGNVTLAYQKWISRMSSQLKPEEQAKYKRDVENAYRAMADFHDKKAAKAYSSPEDKAKGYVKSIELYKKAIEFYKVVLTYDPEDTDIVDWVAKLETFVASLEKRRGAKR